MTAEVAILNPHAVAIAADSAISVSGIGQKIYNTATKLFALSVRQPVAVMFYSNALLGSLAWESIIKEYRRERQDRTFDTVAEMADDFVQYLRRFEQYITDADRHDATRWLARWELRQLGVHIESEREARLRSGGRFTAASERSILRSYVAARTNAIDGRSKFPDLSEAEARSLLRTSVPAWATFVRGQLRNNIQQVDRQDVASLRELVARSMRVTMEWDGATGLVVTGFGSAQMFPALVHYRIEGAIGRNIRTHLQGSAELVQDRRAIVFPFAQRDMVDLLMLGVHPLMRDALINSLPDAMGVFGQHFLDRVEGKLGAADFRALKNDMPYVKQSVYDAFVASIQREINSSHIDPIMSVVSSLPKEELADMAETLVNLTSFRRRITPDPESVGGPVDVAVISPGDGLVWLKRKHYFPQELNFRYFEQNRLNS